MIRSIHAQAGKNRWPGWLSARRGSKNHATSELIVSASRISKSPVNCTQWYAGLTPQRLQTGFWGMICNPQSSQYIGPSLFPFPGTFSGERHNSQCAKPTLVLCGKLLVRGPVAGQLRRDLCRVNVRHARREFKAQQPIAFYAAPGDF